MQHLAAMTMTKIARSTLQIISQHPPGESIT
jgi:hypothetical protein